MPTNKDKLNLVRGVRWKIFFQVIAGLGNPFWAGRHIWSAMTDSGRMYAMTKIDEDKLTAPNVVLSEITTIFTKITELKIHKLTS